MPFQAFTSFSVGTFHELEKQRPLSDCPAAGRLPTVPGHSSTAENSLMGLSLMERRIEGQMERTHQQFTLYKEECDMHGCSGRRLRTALLHRLHTARGPHLQVSPTEARDAEDSNKATTMTCAAGQRAEGLCH